jgi:hypothetical protein
MQQFKSFAPDTRVSGRMVLAFVGCVEYRSINSYLSNHGFLGRQGFQKVDPKGWYYLQDWLDLLGEIVEREDESAAIRDFVNIGRGMVATLNLQEKFTYYPLFEALQSIPYLYDDLHRGEAGSITVRRITRGAFQVVSCIPYPDDLLFGLLTGAAEHHEESHYSVQVNTDAPGRDEGGEVTIYDIGQPD